MNNDIILNVLLVAIWTFLLVYLIMKVVYKPLKINIQSTPNVIMLSYHHGLRSGIAKLVVTSDVLEPVIRKNFDHFIFAVPRNMNYEEVMHWLHTVEVKDMYAAKGKDALELLRAVFLYYSTEDLEAYKPFQARCNQMYILNTIRKHRYVLKNLMHSLAKPDTTKLPLVVPAFFRTT